MYIISLALATAVSLLNATYVVTLITSAALSLPRSIYQLLLNILLPTVAFSFFFAISTKKRPVAKETEALRIAFGMTLLQAIFTFCTLYRISGTYANTDNMFTSYIIAEIIVIIVTFISALFFSIKATKSRAALKDFNSKTLCLINIITGIALALLKVVPYVIQKNQPAFRATASDILSSAVYLNPISAALFAISVYLTVTGAKRMHTAIAWAGFCLVYIAEIIIWVLSA